MARKKLTPKTIAEMQARHAAGASYRDLEQAFGCSAGSVRNALMAKTSKAKAPATEPATVTAGEDLVPPTRDELLTYLSAQARSLRADASAGEPTARAAAHRSLVAVQALITRLLPPAPLDPQVGVFVSAADMKAAADRARDRLHKLIDSADETPPAVILEPTQRHEPRTTPCR